MAGKNSLYLTLLSILIPFFSYINFLFQSINPSSYNFLKSLKNVVLKLTDLTIQFFNKSCSIFEGSVYPGSSPENNYDEKTYCDIRITTRGNSLFFNKLTGFPNEEKEFTLRPLLGRLSSKIFLNQFGLIKEE